MQAIITTLLIVGTFILGWIPAVIWFIIFCKDCILPFESIQLSVTLAIGITVNTLIVLKSFLDPIIYTARMKDFQVSFHRMRCQLFSDCFPHCRQGQQQQGGDEEATMVQFNNRSIVQGGNNLGLASGQHSTTAFVSHHHRLRSMRSAAQSKPIQQFNNGIIPSLPASSSTARPVGHEFTATMITVNESECDAMD